MTVGRQVGFRWVGGFAKGAVEQVGFLSPLVAYFFSSMTTVLSGVLLVNQVK